MIRSGLEQLEERVRDDFVLLNAATKPWIPRRTVEGTPVLDVAVVGAGLCGLVTLAALRRLAIFDARAFDRAPQGREGPWVTFARMETLRTRKEAAGPALGLPSLTFRAWFEAQFGRPAFEAMHLIPRAMWMDYLVWYRRVLELDVSNETAVKRLSPREDGLVELDIQGPKEAGRVLARRAVIATGLDGLGAPVLPEVARKVPARFIAHGADAIDMAALRGKRVGVVGAGASAMDNAASALEAGATSVDIFVRRPEIPRVDKFTGVGSQGMVQGYLGLPDADKWALMVEGERAQIPPPRHSVQRVSRHANARFHLASPILDLAEEQGGVVLTTPKGRYPLDFVIFATGFSVDFSARPEFSAFGEHVLTWGDAYRPPAGQEHAGLAAMPYLGRDFSFRQRRPGACPHLDHIHCFAYPAVPTHGKLTSGIPSISDGATRLARGIARSIFKEDREAHLAAFRSYDVPEIIGDEYEDADALPIGAHA